MKRLSPIFTSLFVTALLLLTAATSSPTTCVALPPLKPIHRICGVVLFPSGDRIANARVTVLQADKEIASQQTGNDGKFSFNHLRAGRYEIRVQVEAVHVAATNVLLVHPEAKPKRQIAVSIVPQGCSSFSLVSPKKFDLGANPNGSSTE